MYAMATLGLIEGPTAVPTDGAGASASGLGIDSQLRGYSDDLIAVDAAGVTGAETACLGAISERPGREVDELRRDVGVREFEGDEVLFPFWPM